MAAFILEDTADDLILRNKYGIYSKKELEKQLRDGFLTVGELSDLYNLKSYQMNHVLNSLGIIFRNTLNDTRVYNPQITKSMHQVLIGTLLGDAYMKGLKSYSVSHSMDQIDYLYHLAYRLGPFVATISDKTHKNGSRSLSFWTYRHSALIPYFSHFYSKGKNKKYILRPGDLDAEGLAYWYMDDGKYKKYGAELCVGNISSDEAEGLIGMLQDNFSIDVSCQCQNKEKGHYSLYIKSNSRSHFFELISPYVIPSMSYKLKGGPPSAEEFNSVKIVQRHVDLCNKLNHFVRYSGDLDVENRISHEINFEDSKVLFMNSVRKAIKDGTQTSRTFFRRLPTEDELIKCWEEGLTDEQIGHRYGFGKNKIGSLRRALGITRKSARISPEQDKRLMSLFNEPGFTVQKAMSDLNMSFYKVKKWMKDRTNKCYQRSVKEKKLLSDLKKMTFDPLSAPLSDYVFAKEDISDEIISFLKIYEWLKSVGVSAKWCFTMRLRGHLAGVQILNEPTAYSKILGPQTPQWECLVQRGCTISWAHKHLGSKMLMSSIRWMVTNTNKRVFVGYSDSTAGEVGVIYQACNFLYLGNKFGVRNKYRHPVYKNGKDFDEHSLRRTSVFKSWCRDNGITMDPSWIKTNGFKDLNKIPVSIKESWYAWGKKIIEESEKIDVEPKGKYVLILGIDRRETRFLKNLFNQKTYPYPKRSNDS